MIKFYILDTNIILHEPESINGLQDNIVCIPDTVIDELDKFKVGSDIKSVNARKFSRLLSNYIKNYNHIDEKLQTLITVNDNQAPVIIIPFDSIINSRGFSFFNTSLNIEKNDNKILLTGLWLKNNTKTVRQSIVETNLTELKKYNDTTNEVILITKDINLRIKTQSLGIETQDYERSKVTQQPTFNGTFIYATSDFIDKLYQNKSIEIAGKWQKAFKKHNLYFNTEKQIDIYENDYFLIKAQDNEKKSVLVRMSDNHFHVVQNNIDIYDIKPNNHKQTFLMDALMNPSIEIVFTIGVAGSGKTLLAIASGLFQTLETNQYDKVVVTRPIIPVGKDIGFLPGTADEKVGPYMSPILDNIGFIFRKSEYSTKEIMSTITKTGKIEILPMPYIRGRTLNNSFIIIDEAQNLTPLEMKTILTRVGVNSKIVITGDIFQIDTPYLSETDNGLIVASDVFRKNNTKNATTIFLDECERSVVSDLAGKLL
jgi:PhoH-like ATPase